MTSVETHLWFAAILQHSLDAAFLTRPNGDILYANPAACALFGYAVEEFRAVGRDALLDLTDPRLPAALAERQQTGRFAGVLGMRRRGGQLFPAEISSAIFEDESGELRTSTFIGDITERERRAVQLEATNRDLTAALAEVSRLQGILPICSYCKRIRDDQDYWQQVEAYISSHASVQFSHGICPSCYAAHVAPQLRR